MEATAPHMNAQKETPLVQPLSQLQASSNSEATKRNNGIEKSPTTKPKIPSRSITPSHRPRINSSIEPKNTKRTTIPSPNPDQRKSPIPSPMGPQIPPPNRVSPPQYGPIITLRIGTHPAVFIADRSIAYKALVLNGALFADRPPPLPVSKIASSNQHNINTASYDSLWRLLRRNLTSQILHPSRVKSYARARKWVLDILLKSYARAHKKKE